MLFVAQLWKYIDGKLENKNGNWMYMEETWTLSNESNSEEGEVVVIRDSIGRGLKVDLDIKGMNFKVKHKTFHIIFAMPNYFVLKTYRKRKGQMVLSS